jgi:hypothetical protein
MYPVDTSHVWIWLGGDSTTNAAPFLAPDFYRVPNQDLDGTATGWGYHFTQMCSWGNLVLTGNNFFADTDILAPEGVPSWWRLDDQNTYRFCKWSVDWKGRKVYGVQMGLRSADDPVLVEYDIRVLTDYYSWQSHPLPFTIDPAKQSNLRQVGVTAVGEGTVTVTVTSAQNPTGQTEVFTFESDNADGVSRRYANRQVRNFDVTGSHHQVRIESRALSDNGEAPTVHIPVSLGFRPASHIPRST